MSVEQNKAVARRWNEEVWCSQPGRDHGPHRRERDLARQRGPGATSWAGRSPRFRRDDAAFPDTSVEIVHLLGENDMVTVHFRATGTHQGRFQGIEPTGNRVEVTGMAIKRLHNGKIVEEWQIFDALGLLRQLDAIPG